MNGYRVGSDVCHSLEAGSRLEWLVPDGHGGYAMGTASTLRTRRYHGLLVVSGDVPARRMMALAALDPVLTLPSGAKIRLATHTWASGAVAPTGHCMLEEFELDEGVPTWRWQVEDARLECQVATAHGAAQVGVTFRLLAGGPVELTLEPLCTWRDAHGERRAEHGLRVEHTTDGFVVERAYRVAGPGWQPDGAWYHDVFYREEAARGLNPVEDLFRPGRFTQRLEVGQRSDVRAWAGDLAEPAPPPAELIALAQRRHRLLSAGSPLAPAADAFVVRTASGPDVVAGYPWFGCWSRDTMISYEGLFLTTGWYDQGRELLASYARTLSEGMLANTADTGSVEYNTADATLWFLHAVARHVEVSGDTDLAEELAPALRDVVAHHLAGTRYGIRVDTDGLLTQGSDGWSLTWMDAVIHGHAVTPRRGKAVELNALWINGLGGLTALGVGDYGRLREAAVTAFERRFPAPQGWLYDVVDGPQGDDASLRPNQLLAIGLPYAPLRSASPELVRTIARELVTPVGLRTLSPHDPAYLGQHRGDPGGRDHAYHQGTVWPWLLGPYADALAAVGLDHDGLFEGLTAHLSDAGLGSISETTDGDAPHTPTGCPFQAWSVAEYLRTLSR